MRPHLVTGLNRVLENVLRLSTKASRMELVAFVRLMKVLVKFSLATLSKSRISRKDGAMNVISGNLSSYRLFKRITEPLKNEEDPSMLTY